MTVHYQSSEMIPTWTPVTVCPAERWPSPITRCSGAYLIKKRFLIITANNMQIYHTFVSDAKHRGSESKEPFRFQSRFPSRASRAHRRESMPHLRAQVTQPVE